MYYTYQTILKIEDSIDALGDLGFHIKLKKNMFFLLAGCYFSLQKEYGESDSVMIRCFQRNRNREEAVQKVRYAMEYFIFLTGAPYDTNDYLIESTEMTLPYIDINLSRKRMLELQVADNAYRRIRKKKELLENALHLYSTAVKLNFLFDEKQCEDAFFAFFKVIEIIVKDDFLIEKNNIERKNDLMQAYVTKILHNIYNIETANEKLLDISGKRGKILFDIVFDGIYHKIIWFSKKHNIKIDCNKLSTIVKVRNAIAHGDKVSFEEYLEEYRYTVFLSRQVILAKFFDLKFPKIPVEIKV